MSPAGAVPLSCHPPAAGTAPRLRRGPGPGGGGIDVSQGTDGVTWGTSPQNNPVKRPYHPPVLPYSGKIPVYVRQRVNRGEALARSKRRPRGRRRKQSRSWVLEVSVGMAA